MTAAYHYQSLSRRDMPQACTKSDFRYLRDMPVHVPTNFISYGYQP